MSPPIVTVVIPTLDEVSTLGRCLELERLHDLDTRADLRRALDGETLGGEMRSRLQATAGSVGRACAP